MAPDEWLWLAGAISAFAGGKPWSHHGWGLRLAASHARNSRKRSPSPSPRLAAHHTPAQPSSPSSTIHLASLALHPRPGPRPGRWTCPDNAQRSALSAHHSAPTSRPCRSLSRPCPAPTPFPIPFPFPHPHPHPHPHLSTLARRPHGSRLLHPRRVAADAMLTISSCACACTCTCTCARACACACACFCIYLAMPLPRPPTTPILSPHPHLSTPSHPPSHFTSHLSPRRS
jgi:hypothetical protein